MNVWQSRDNWQKFFTITAILVLIINSIFCFYTDVNFSWFYGMLSIYAILVILHNELNNKQIIEW